MSNESNKNEKNTQNKSLGDRLFELFIIAVAVWVLIIMAFMVIDIRVSAVMAGIFFMVFGFIAIAKIKITSKTWEILLLPVIGLPMTVIPAYLMLSEHNPEKFPPFGEKMILMFWGVLAFAIGLGMIVITAVSRIRMKKCCTFAVNAACVDYVKVHSRGINYYRPVWEYSVNGQKYKKAENVSSLRRKPELGYVQTIMVNLNDPGEFYRRESTGYIMFIIIGISMIFVGSIILTSVMG